MYAIRSYYVAAAGVQLLVSDDARFGAAADPADDGDAGVRRHARLAAAPHRRDSYNFV